MTKRQRTVGILLLGIITVLSVWVFFAMLHSNTAVQRIFSDTDLPCDAPHAFSAFHLVWLGGCVLFSVLLGVLGARRGECVTDSVVFGAGLFLLILEVYKQLYYTFILHGGRYDFSILPFQFCSLPLYLYLLTPLLPKGRGKDALYRFLGLYATMGGCLVMAYPSFYQRVSLNWHTMIWHTVMIGVGVLILFSRGYGVSWRREMPAPTVMFVTFVALATCLNIRLYPLSQSSPAPLNLLYMSPYYQNRNFWIIRRVWSMLGWEAALLTYVLLFIFVGATLVFLIAFLFHHISNQIQKRKKLKKFQNTIAFSK